MKMVIGALASSRRTLRLLWMLILLGFKLLILLVPEASAGFEAIDRDPHPRHCGGGIRHVHLSVGPDPATQMIVSFATIPSRHPAPVGGVLVGTSPTRMHDVYTDVPGESPAYYNQTVYKSSHLYYSPYYHHITISGLKPSTTYFYRPIVHMSVEEYAKYNIRNADELLSEVKMVEELEDEFMEQDETDQELNGRRRELLDLPPYDGSRYECPSPYEVRSFTTAPASPKSGSTSDDNDDEAFNPVTFAILGDLGQFTHSEETVSRLIQDRNEINSIILAGDIAYTEGNPLKWDTFFDFFDDYLIIDRIPMQIVPGNHDIEKQKDANDIFLAYEHRFRMPRVRPPELGLYDGPVGRLDMDTPPYPLPYEWGNAYYAYSYGPVRFIMISSYSSMNPDSVQYRWIKEELDSVNRRVTPWVVVVLHTPIYNTWGVHRKDKQILAAREHLEPLFVQHRANFVFSGHIHAYLRTKTVAHEVVDPTGPVHVTVGAGGRKCDAPFRNEIPEPWVDVRDATMYGYGMLRIVNRTHAIWEWIHTGFADDHKVNQLFRSDMTFPPGPEVDKVMVENQYFL